MTPAEAIAAIYAKTRRSIAEYAAVPSTTGNNLTGPCVRGCGRTARTHRGVCRECLRDNKGER